MEAAKAKTALAILLFLHGVSIVVVVGVTDPNDLAVLNQFRKGLENADLLKWPENDDDPCGPPSWPHVFCSGDRVAQIQVSGLGLKGPLPENFNQLSKLYNVGLQKNHFNRQLPSFSGLSELRYAYLDFNDFDAIPPDFFKGLPSLEVLALDFNPLNASDGGWSLPPDLQESAQLKNLTLMGSNLAGPLPEFLGTMPSLEVLRLSRNQLAGPIPASFNGSLLSVLWLNEQSPGMSGPIDVISSMASLTSLWLHGNKFSGKIPDNIGGLVSLEDLDLNGNELVGLIPASLATLPLSRLDLNNNRFMGPAPKFKAANVSYKSNPFCVLTPGSECAPDVMALLEFLDGVDYPLRLVGSWAGNDPCGGSWLGVGCDGKKNIVALNLPKNNLSGAISPSIASLTSLTRIYLNSNNLSGSIPPNFTRLKSLSVLDLSYNNLSPPAPRFDHVVNINLDGNPLMMNKNNSSGNNPSSESPAPSSPSSTRSSPRPKDPADRPAGGVRKTSKTLYLILAVAASSSILVCLIVPLALYACKKRKKERQLVPTSLVVHPRDPTDSDSNTVKIAVGTTASSCSLTGSTTNGYSRGTNVGEETHRIEAGGLIISVQVLRKVTKNFAPDNELGRGGFGVVYKGELDDGTQIAVKRMESSGVVTNKALDEFQAEIAVLSKVCHKHLVSLLGYSVEGSERILVYEYMPQGSLSKHLFHWKKSKVEPLSWKRRLNIALDVARGVEYLHTLAHQSFIHRDLKSSNILLGDDFRAKVSDFGLVKLAPDGKKSVATRLAGTFGYLAPEYAVTGKITTKADVFSFGVVLMELVTGMMALDEDRPEESHYLVPWFWQVKSSKETLLSAVDPTLDHGKEDVLEGITAVSELAGHCTAREPNQRPDMGHAVNVLASLVEKWRPVGDEAEEYCGIDYSLPLGQMVKDWKEAEGKEDGGDDYDDDDDGSFANGIEDSKGSIPTRPVGFAESFTSEDGR